MSISNKIVGAFASLILLTIFSSVYISFNIHNIEKNENKLSDIDFAGITVLLEADRDSYQSNVALSQIINLQDKTKIAKLVESVNDNLQQVRQRFDKFKSFLAKEMPEHQAKFDQFEASFGSTEQDTKKLISLFTAEEYKSANQYYFDHYLHNYESMRDLIDFFTEATYTVVEKDQNDIKYLVSHSLNIFMTIMVISILVAIFFTFILRRNINNSITNFRDGLLGFFHFLNKESTDVKLLDDSANDEISEIAKVVNQNITNTQSLLEKDEAVIEDVKNVVEMVKNGSLDQKIIASTHNQSLEELKSIFNEMLQSMAEHISNDLNEIKKALEEFQKFNFTHRIENATGDTVDGLNTLANIINDMLVENKSNGLTLQNSATSLLANVDNLSRSSNEAAASIEETAAALEEITSNISHNTENVVKMANNAGDLKKAANEGQALASDTSTAMDSINEQVESINNAISVIDQIAFQTNILSLNAAVEAATAGEAGKGFAVVAQEVRNLASRSAEAAKEIKELVENATLRANEGKDISSKMIDGYVKLNDNISTTLELISDVENASKEQQTGIVQINDAVNILDRQTQRNASVANEAKDIANETQAIANDIVDDTNEKEFIGKESVKAKNKQVNQYTPVAQTEVANKSQNPVPAPKNVAQTKNIADKSDETDWESF